VNQPELNLVVLYHAQENTYSISAHNRTPDEVSRLIAAGTPHLEPGLSLLTLKQRKPHKSADAASCRTCRETVQRSSGLRPVPKFQRRK
jgi:hypothetical protein